MESKQRSLGVSILGWLNIFASIAALLSIYFLRARIYEFEKHHFILPDSYHSVVQIHSAFEFIICFAVGIGLLKLIPWARILVVIQAFIYFVYCTIFFFVFTYKYTIPYFNSTGSSAFFLYATIPASFGWLLFVVYYFNRASVKSQFIKKSLI